MATWFQLEKYGFSAGSSDRMPWLCTHPQGASAAATVQTLEHQQGGPHMASGSIPTADTIICCPTDTAMSATTAYQASKADFNNFLKSKGKGSDP